MGLADMERRYAANIHRELQAHPDRVEAIDMSTYAVSDVTSDVLTTDSGDALTKGVEVKLIHNGGTLPPELTDGEYYWIIPVGTNEVKLATKLGTALTGVEITLTNSADIDATLCPVVYSRGYLFVGSSGALKLRTAAGTDGLMKGIAAGTLWPFDVIAVHTEADGESLAGDILIFS